MAEKIGITKSEVSSIVSDLQNEHEKIATYITRLDKELEAINAAWKGIDATKYTSKMKDDYKVLLTEFNESLQSYIDFLSGVYGQYEKLDTEFAGKTIEV